MDNSNQKDTKKEHYVPIAYLANFGINGNNGRDTIAFIYSKDTKRVIESNFETIACENKFYWIPELDNNKNILEIFFSQLEIDYSNHFNNLYNRIIINPKLRKSNSVQMSCAEKDFFSSFLAIQTVRTRAHRNFYKSVYDNMMTIIPDRNNPNYTKKDFQRVHTNSLLELDMANFYANLISDRKWVFLINHTTIPFFTSDNPFIFINHDRRIHFSVVEHRVTGFFPITPRIAIQFFDKSIPRVDNSYFDIFDSKYIVFYNLWIRDYSTRFVISNKNVFEDCFLEGFDNE